MTMLVLFGAIAVLAATCERLFPEREQRVLRAGLLTDGVYAALNILLRIVFNASLGLAAIQLASTVVPSRFIGVLSGHSIAVQAIAVILAFDFIFYWTHRAKHRWAWWWRLHETHHSSVELDWFSSVRFHPFEKILDRTIYLVPIVFFGVSETALLILAGVDALQGTFAHANIRLKLGPLKYLLVGPQMHRWHHSSNPEDQNSNFGNNLSIFDWIFGTARVPAAAPLAFGTVDPAFPAGNIASQFLYVFRSRSG